ncbi:large subunit ribosomal protein L36e [Nematocida sp. AWRm80]|nr:large subunit ribosomal protein L36e [Nematocida sp. AWRm80]
MHKFSAEKIQPIKGEVQGNGSIFGKKAGYPVKKIPSKRSHVKSLYANPSKEVALASERYNLAKSIAKEISGFAPYEKRAMDLGRKGEDKKMKKFLKKRLGTMKAARRKQEQLLDAIRQGAK